MASGLLSLLVFLGAAVIQGHCGCRSANWWISFDSKGVSTCDSSTEYINGLYRNGRSGDDNILLVEEAHCCSRDSAFSNSPSQVMFANWWGTFDRANQWNTCPNGFFLHGLYRNGGRGGLWLIEEAVCSKPATHPYYYGHCYDHSVVSSFDDEGWSKCNSGYFLTGLYRGGCGWLYCLETFRCCRMAPGPAPLTSHEDVKSRVMDTTMAEISLLAHYLGYGWCSGCRAQYVGQDFRRQGDSWVADQSGRCEGYQSHRRLSIHYGDWSYDIKDIVFGDAVINELTPQAIDSGTLVNNDAHPSSKSVVREERVARTVTHTTTSEFSASVDMGITIGYMPPMATGGPTATSTFNFGFRTSTATTDSSGNEQASTFVINESKTLAPYSAVRWRLLLSKTRVTIPYTATVVARFSTELRGFLRWGGGSNAAGTNYHTTHRGSGARPDFNYKFGNGDRAFYQALKQESDQSAYPWLWTDMKNAHSNAQSVIDSLTREDRYEFTLTGKFDDVHGTHVDFRWDEMYRTDEYEEEGTRRRRSTDHHNDTITVVRSVAKVQEGDPPPVFPDPPQVLLDPGTPIDVKEPVTQET